MRRSRSWFVVSKDNILEGQLETKAFFLLGPPAQVNAVAGKKDGFKQGELGGALKELGYTSDQVIVLYSSLNGRILTL